MPKVGGPKSYRRKTITSVVLSATLYGASIWHVALKHNHYVNLLTSINRHLSLLITSAYRTAPTRAIELIAGMIPIDLLVKERIQIDKKGNTFKNEIRVSTINQWQKRWKYNGWTKIFIGDIASWIKNNAGYTDFYLTQAFTGHGVFGSYLKKIKKQENNDCWFCGKLDDPEHTLFQCEKFEDIRLQSQLL